MIRRGADQTEYCISAIPLGGYVKLLDEREGDVAPAEVHRSFNQQSILARIAVLVAGPLMNFVFAILAYWLMFVSGVPGLQSIVGDIEPDSIAAQAGLESGDRIVGVGDQTVETWEGALLAILDEMLDTGAIQLVVISPRGGDKRLTLDVDGRISELTEPGALFPGLGMSPWSPVLDPVLGDISPGEAAAQAGFERGDRIISAGGLLINGWMQWVEYVRAHPNENVAVVAERAGERLTIDLQIASVTTEDGDLIGRIGAGPEVPEGFMDQYRSEQKYRPVKAVAVALERTWSMSVLTVRMVGRMITGDVSVKNISGPINIAQYAGYSAAIGLASFLSFLAIVSLSLGILNLLPIPLLDGGQIVYQLAEWIKGSPLSERAQLVGQQIGIVFLVLLMGVAFYNDLTRLFS